MEPKDTISDGPAPEAEHPAEPVTVAAPAAAPAAAPVAKRPRGRTALLLVAAAVLGIAGGTAVGYDVQAGRAPTPLPVLAQPGLAYPSKALPRARAPTRCPRPRTTGSGRTATCAS
ncbi:hypothetical protein ABZ622_04010 [Streptomyces sp. NPDC007164]|uniref:hypothetical protein n=1 Tax=Streptomyces sp. NPDC007164 TaxID=3156918 RepID=UPI0033EE4C85